MDNKGVMLIEVSKCDEIYKQLEVEMYKEKEDIDYGKLMFLTGAVQALRLISDYEVPEIELAFILLKEHFGGKTLCA
jgi:proteasome assembly chaperone (PAC2) family protein